MTWLLLLIPLSLILRYAVHASPLWVFAVAALAIVPLAEWIRRATDQIARVAGSAIGGLLNVTFGNVAELILALFVLSAGRPDVVKGQITGSFIGNGLLGLGLAIIVGSWGRTRQTFSPPRSSPSCSTTRRGTRLSRATTRQRCASRKRWTLSRRRCTSEP